MEPVRHSEDETARIHKIISEFSKKISVDKLVQSCLGKTQVEQGNFEQENIVCGKWMTMILVCGSDLEVTFKVHYPLKAAKQVLAESLGKEESEISTEKSQDFMREFCNLCAGSIKSELEKQNIVTGLSIPLSLRGSDELVMTQRKNYFANSSYWTLDCGESTFVCSLYMEINNQDGLKNLKAPAAPEKKKRKIAFL